jgi:cystathionine beta-lyase/cystathionine gamma-synthase
MTVRGSDFLKKKSTPRQGGVFSEKEGFVAKPKPPTKRSLVKRTTKRSKLQKSESKNLQIKRLEQRINQKLEATTRRLEEKSKESALLQKANLAVNTLRLLWEFVRSGNHL